MYVLNFINKSINLDKVNVIEKGQIFILKHKKISHIITDFNIFLRIILVKLIEYK